MKIKFVKLWDLSRYSERTTSERPTCLNLTSNLEGFVWSHQSITGLISQRQFSPLCWFLVSRRLSDVVLSEYLDKSHNFTNLIFMTSQFSTLLSRSQLSHFLFMYLPYQSFKEGILIRNELTHLLNRLKSPFLFTYSTNILVCLLTVNEKNFFTLKIRKCATPF